MMSPVCAAYAILRPAALSAIHCVSLRYAAAQIACSSAVSTSEGSSLPSQSLYVPPAAPSVR